MNKRAQQSLFRSTSFLPDTNRDQILQRSHTDCKTLPMLPGLVVVHPLHTSILPRRSKAWREAGHVAEHLHTLTTALYVDILVASK